MGGVLLDQNRYSGAGQKAILELNRKVIGQEEAVQTVVDVLEKHFAGLSNPTRTINNLLFLGPTGTGKTRLVEAVAELLFENSRAMIKIDCSEFQHSHEIARLIGSPPGYLGHRETHPVLTQDALDEFHSEKVKVTLLLLDEVEKASDALWKLMLGIMDKASLTLGDNRKVDCSKVILFMTSNLGADEMASVVSGGIGFNVPKDQKALNNKLNTVAIERAKKHFTPEFMNRVDKSVVFNSLGETDIKKILSVELDLLKKRMFGIDGTPFVLSVSSSAREVLIEDGYDPQYGARHLKRSIETHLINPVSRLLASGQIEGGDQILVKAESGRLVFTKEKNLLAKK